MSFSQVFMTTSVRGQLMTVELRLSLAKTVVNNSFLKIVAYTCQVKLFPEWVNGRVDGWNY